MKIYVRSDLNMRKGKIASQISHAVVGLWLNAMEQSEECFKLTGKNYNLHKLWLDNGAQVEIIQVSSEEELLNKKTKESVLIKDQGRTEFNEPTHTCLSNFDNIEIKSRLSCETISNKPAKQTLIANRDLKLNKWILPEYASRAAWKVLLNKMEDTGSELVLMLNEEGLKNWLLGAFAKITLKIDSINIKEMKNDLKRNNIDFYEEKKGEETVVLVTSPRFIEELDKCTSHLKLY
jgi:peptidyl-tRNA hydrolase